MNINANTDAGVRVFQPLPDNLSRSEQIDYTIGALVTDMRFALLEIAKLREEGHTMKQLRCRPFVRNRAQRAGSRQISQHWYPSPS